MAAQWGFGVSWDALPANPVKLNFPPVTPEEFAQITAERCRNIARILGRQYVYTPLPLFRADRPYYAPIEDEI